jgi:TctA family transporter
MSDFFEIIQSLFTLQVLVPWILAMTFGIFVGSTPGLTATMAVALVIPLSYNLPKEAALAMVIGVSFTAILPVIYPLHSSASRARPPLRQPRLMPIN